MEVDEALVHLELVAVPGLRTLTARRLTGGNRKDLGGEADRALDAELLVLSAVDEVARDYTSLLTQRQRYRILYITYTSRGS